MAHDIGNGGQFRSLLQQAPRHRMAQRMHTAHRAILLFNTAPRSVPIQDTPNRAAFHRGIRCIRREKNEWRFRLGPSIFDVINNGLAHILQQRLRYPVACLMLDKLKFVSFPF